MKSISRKYTFPGIKFHQEATQGQQFFFLISLPLALVKIHLQYCIKFCYDDSFDILISRSTVCALVLFSVYYILHSGLLVWHCPLSSQGKCFYLPLLSSPLEKHFLYRNRTLQMQERYFDFFAYLPTDTHRKRICCTQLTLE